MLIRSQDKLHLIDKNGIEVYIVGEEVRATRWVDHYIILGEYKTKEQAIKVLDDICRSYENSEYTNNFYNGVELVPYIYKNNTVFNMPQMEE